MKKICFTLSMVIVMVLSACDKPAVTDFTTTSNEGVISDTAVTTSSETTLPSIDEHGSTQETTQAAESGTTNKQSTTELLGNRVAETGYIQLSLRQGITYVPENTGGSSIDEYLFLRGMNGQILYSANQIKSANPQAVAVSLVAYDVETDSYSLAHEFKATNYTLLDAAFMNGSYYALAIDFVNGIRDDGSIEYQLLSLNNNNESIIAHGYAPSAFSVPKLRLTQDGMVFIGHSDDSDKVQLFELEEDHNLIDISVPAGYIALPDSFLIKSLDSFSYICVDESSFTDQSNASQMLVSYNGVTKQVPAERESLYLFGDSIALVNPKNGQISLYNTETTEQTISYSSSALHIARTSQVGVDAISSFYTIGDVTRSVLLYEGEDGGVSGRILNEFTELTQALCIPFDLGNNIWAVRVIDESEPFILFDVTYDN